MASRRITRETFDAVVQDKVKRYRMERGDAMEDTIHHFKGNRTQAWRALLVPALLGAAVVDCLPSIYVYLPKMWTGAGVFPRPCLLKRLIAWSD